MATEVIVVRHAETYGNLEGRFCGHSETELTPKGIQQAQALGLRLKGETFDAAYSSDLSRAIDTARYSVEHHATPLEPATDPDPREMHYGEWEGLPATEIGARQADLLRDFFMMRIPGAPGGETIEQVRERTAGAIRRVVDTHQGGRLLVVSHGNAIMAMLAELMGMPRESTWSFAVANTSVTRLQFGRSGRVMLTGFNDHSHTLDLRAEESARRKLDLVEDSAATRTV